MGELNPPYDKHGFPYEKYVTQKLNERVKNVEPDMLTRFRWRAERRAKKLNERILFNSYRWEVHDWLDGRWAVLAMQNRLVPRP